MKKEGRGECRREYIATGATRQSRVERPGNREMGFESPARSVAQGRSRHPSSQRPFNRTIAANAGVTTSTTNRQVAGSSPAGPYMGARSSAGRAGTSLQHLVAANSECIGSGNAGRNYILSRCSGHLLVPPPRRSRRMPMGVHWGGGSGLRFDSATSHRSSSPVLTLEDPGRHTGGGRYPRPIHHGACYGRLRELSTGYRPSPV